MTHAKIHAKWTKIHFFLQISHLSSNRRVRNLALYFQSTNPGKKAHPQNEIRVPRKARILDMPCFFATLSQRNANLPRKAQILDTPCFFATLSQRNANLPRKARILDMPCFFATLSQRNANLPRKA